MTAKQSRASMKMADVSGSGNNTGNNKRKVKLNKNGKVVKKRTRNLEEWKKNFKQKQKVLRIAGLEYMSANGKIMPPKRPGPDCKCRRKCFQKVPEDVRQQTFQGFYSLKTYDEQNAYLFGLMRQVDVKRRKPDTCSPRTCTFQYFVRVRGRETQVCLAAFMNIHAITEKKVRVLCRKMDNGVMFPNDNRGKVKKPSEKALKKAAQSLMTSNAEMVNNLALLKPNADMVNNLALLKPNADMVNNLALLKPSH